MRFERASESAICQNHQGNHNSGMEFKWTFWMRHTTKDVIESGWKTNNTHSHRLIVFVSIHDQIELEIKLQQIMTWECVARRMMNLTTI